MGSKLQATTAMPSPRSTAPRSALRVGEARAERDADRAAERALAPPANACACGGSCPRCQATAATASTTTVPPALAVPLRSAGAALPASERAFMEPRLQADFGGVRIHADARARAAAAALDARALTFGEHIIFGAGERIGDRRLLSHELAHVVQQRASGARVQRKGNDKKPAPAATPADDAAFWQWWKLVIGFEGSLEAWKANPGNASDKGGETNWGVTKEGYLRHAKALGLEPTEEGFAALTPDQAVRFGRMMWKASGASRIKNPGVAIIIADWYWGGISLRRLTALLKAKGHEATYDKGSPSQATTDFINTLPPGELIESMSDVRAEQYRAIAKADPTQQKFLAGWLGRSEKRRSQAREFAPEATPQHDVDAQLSLWEQAQRALRHARTADNADQRAAARAEVQAAIAAIDRREAAGFAHDEEADSTRRLRDELRAAQAGLDG